MRVVASWSLGKLDSTLRFLKGGWTGSWSLFRLDELRGSRTPVGRARAVMFVFRGVEAL